MKVNKVWVLLLFSIFIICILSQKTLYSTEKFYVGGQGTDQVDHGRLWAPVHAALAEGIKQDRRQSSKRDIRHGQYLLDSMAKPEGPYTGPIMPSMASDRLESPASHLMDYFGGLTGVKSDISSSVDNSLISNFNMYASTMNSIWENNADDPRNVGKFISNWAQTLDAMNPDFMRDALNKVSHSIAVRTGQTNMIQEYMKPECDEGTNENCFSLPDKYSSKFGKRI